MREFGVEAGNNHVMGAMRRDLPGIVLARANGRTQIGKAFMSEGRYFPFLFYDARTMSPSPQPPGQDNPVCGSNKLILTDTENGVPFWAEDDLTDAASANYLDRLLKRLCQTFERRSGSKPCQPLGRQRERILQPHAAAGPSGGVERSDAAPGCLWRDRARRSSNGNAGRRGGYWIEQRRVVPQQRGGHAA